MKVDDTLVRQFLLDSGLVGRAQLDAIAEQQRPLGRALVEMGYLGEDDLRRAVAHAHGIPFVSLGEPELEALQLIPEPVARAHGVVAFAVSEQGVEVAVLDLDDLDAVDFLRNTHRVLPRLTAAAEMKRALFSYQKKLKERYGAELGRHLQAIAVPHAPAERSARELRFAAAGAGAQEGAARAAELLLEHALLARANAVHLQTEERSLLVRYRIGGVLRDAMHLAPHAGAALVARFKSLAGLSVAPSTLPQEGKFKIEKEHESLGVRVSVIPAHGGEKLLLQLARGGEGRRGYSLAGLGIHGEALEALEKVLHKRQGLLLVAGAADAGKTTLLYTLLDLLNTPELSLASVEARVEHRLPHVAQVATRGAGMSPAAALRAVLRQDPDVVMVGELADAESAALAAAAAARGMFVLAGAESAEELNLAPSVVVRTALVRKLCTKKFHAGKKLSRAQADQLEEHADFARVLAALKEEGAVPADTQWKDLEFVAPQGCSECSQGYQGRVGLQEVTTPQGLAGLSLVEDGIFKAVTGQTSIEEILGLC